MVLEQVLIQPLRRIDLIQPWRAAGKPSGIAGDSLLAGGLVLHFGELAVVFTSPLRTSSCQSGTFVGVADTDDLASLGYRMNVVPAADLDCLFSACERRTSLPGAEWLAARQLRQAAPLHLMLADFRQLGDLWQLHFLLLGLGWFSVGYRRDLDGAIELAPPGTGLKLDRIVVNTPDDEFGWLHPASAHPFVLDGWCWRSAHPRDWPLTLRKAAQSHADPDAFYASTLRRALTARFAQHPRYRGRLLALTLPVEVKGVPPGVLDSVRAMCAQIEAGLRA